MNGFDLSSPNFVKGGIAIALGVLLMFYLFNITEYAITLFLLITSVVFIAWGLRMTGITGFFKKLFGPKAPKSPKP